MPTASNAVQQGPVLTDEQKAALQEFEKEMTGSVIPEIVRVVEQRRALATLSRQWALKVGG
jgi:hypothetical protein